MTEHERAIIKIGELGRELIERGKAKDDEGLTRIGLALISFPTAAFNENFGELMEHILEFTMRSMEAEAPPHIQRLSRKVRAINYAKGLQTMN